MSENRAQRKLATILAADVVGYSRLMGEDEEATAKALRASRKTIDGLIADHEGRVFGSSGDSVIAEFSSPVEALRCAVEIQKSQVKSNENVPANRRMEYRIGVNIGDIMVEGDNLLGDGVNIAARLEALASPGGIFISRIVFDQVHKKVKLGYEDLGAQKFKNIAEPVRTYKVLSDPASAGTLVAVTRRDEWYSSWAAKAAVVVLFAVIAGLVWWKPWGPDVEVASIKRMAFPLPDKPSIAVLPFANLSNDKSPDLLADGITEDIITDLSKISNLFVLGHNSTIKYKGKSVEARQVAEAFGVRYVLYGSIRRGGDKLRISVRLIDAVSGRQLWAERFDRELNDLFVVQSDVTSQVVKSLAITLNASETERLYERHTTNIKAYETFLRARKSVLTPSKENVEFAEKLFQRVIDLDPKFAGGYAGLSLNYSMKARFRFGTNPKEERKLSLELAQKAVQIDKNFAWSYIALGGAHLAHRNPDAAVASILQALVIQPNGYEENLWMGFYAHFAGQSAVAVERLEKAIRISPTDNNRNLSFRAMAYFMNGNYAKSVDMWKERIRTSPVGAPIPYTFLAGALVLLGKMDEAATAAAKQRELFPAFRLSKWGYIKLYKLAENRQRLHDAATKAGVPE